MCRLKELTLYTQKVYQVIQYTPAYGLLTGLKKGDFLPIIQQT